MAGRLRAAVLSVCIGLAACTPATPDELLADAQAAIAAREYRTAEIHLKNLLQQQRDNATARQLLGGVLLATGDAVGAEQNFRLALDLGADAAALDLPLLNALVAQLKFDAALELISSRGLPRGADDTAEVAVLRGAAHRGLGQAERAVEVYREALRTDPDAANVRSDLAATLLGLGQTDAGRELVTAVLNDEPDYAPALLLRGNLEATSRQLAAAEATFQRVVDLETAGAARSQRYLLAMAQLVEVQVALGKIDAAKANADAFLALDERSPLARHAKAVVEMQEGDLASAEQRLETLIAEAPAYWPAHRLLGAINIRQEQFGQATQYLRAAVNNNPADGAARLQLAELYIREGDVDAARRLMEGSPVGGNSELFLAFAGGASQRAGLSEQASQYFDQSEQEAPTSLQQLVGLSNLYAAAGEFERAVRLLQSSSLGGGQGQDISDYLLTLVHIRQGDLQSAEEVATRLQQRHAEAAWPLNLRGTIALLRSDLGGARTSFARAIELEPRDVPTMLNLARVAAADNDVAKAEQHLQQALAVDPAQPMALLGLAQYAMGRRDLAAARSLLGRAPESPARMRSEAELFILEGRFDDAAQLLAQLFVLQPSEAIALRAYEVARRAGRANADAQLRQWHADHPDAPATNFALGSAAIEAGDTAEAESRFEAVVATNPNHAATLNNLAWLYGERKDPRAIELGVRALAAQPDNPSIADTLGWLYVQNGDAARGLPLLAQAAETLPDERDIGYHWAVALADTGDSARAIEVLQRVTADAVPFASRTDAERRLSDLRRRTH
ncbi:MAG TPA: tetratricopeptide repeat protein [Gammaproteobacteria bacterium]|nr:tetratricopeptide repeat protein [Gammaproteobacteria bacterium]